MLDPDHLPHHLLIRSRGAIIAARARECDNFAERPYLRVEPSEKLEAIEATIPLNLRRGRFKAPDALIASLLGTT